MPVHHLGMFRDKATLSAVEYYNNLPYHQEGGPSELVILLDPIVATGETACAAIETLRDWGVGRIVMLCVLGSEPGLRRAAELWPEGVVLWAAGMDLAVDRNGMICESLSRSPHRRFPDRLTPIVLLQPGLGDVGDRLFLTLGK